MVYVIAVQYHDFKQIQIQNNIVLAKCTCCVPSRFAVFVINNGDRSFYYHGYDYKYAQKLFSQLINSQQSQ